MQHNSLDIGGRQISDSHVPLVIAEIGNNHDGDKKQALSLIQAAANAGADAVKFQTYSADRLVTPDHELHQFFSNFALPLEWHEELKAAAEAHGMLFLSTPFDLDSLQFLIDLGVPAIKIASSDLTNIPLLKASAQSRLPLLISTGMATLEEIGDAIETAHMQDNHSLVIMQCESRYPAPVESANISLICEFKRLFAVQAGFSDHSLSTHLPAAASALGARVIEKHFTLDRNLGGPDHAVALEPEEFRRMAEGCREAVRALGDRRKRLTDEIRAVRAASLRGLYAARDISQGEAITGDMLVALRPSAEITVDRISTVLNRRAGRNIRRGEPICLTFLLDE